MNLSKLPLTDQFSSVWKDDPALDRERLDKAHAADPMQPDFADAYKRAQETQDWSALAKDGERPTVFSFRLLNARTAQRLRDAIRSGSIGVSESLGLAFRVGVVAIDGWARPLPEFKRRNDPEYAQLGEMLTSTCYDALTARTGLELTESLGAEVLERSTTPLPLSSRG